VDIDAEMKKLQAEARKTLANRAEEAAVEPQLPPTPIPEQLKAKTLELTEDLKAKAKAEVFKPEILLEATKLAETATEGSSLSIGAKIGIGVAALITFLITWELILGPLVMALITIAFLVLIVTGILKLVGFFDKDTDEDTDEDTEEDTDDEA
jgi:hypothetical protein